MTDPAVIALRCIATRPRTDAAARAGVLSSSARHCPRSGRLAVLLRTGIHRATTENKNPRDGNCPKQADHLPVALRNQLNPDDRQRKNRRHHHERAAAPPRPLRSTRNGLAHTVTGAQQPPVKPHRQPASPRHRGRRDCHHHRGEPARRPPARRADQQTRLTALADPAQHVDTTDSSRSHRAHWPTGLARHSKPNRPAEIAPAVKSDAQM